MTSHQYFDICNPVKVILTKSFEVNYSLIIPRSVLRSGGSFQVPGGAHAQCNCMQQLQQKLSSNKVWLETGGEKSILHFVTIVKTVCRLIRKTHYYCDWRG